MTAMFRPFMALVSAALFVACATPGFSAQPVPHGPVLDPKTGSYFELKDDNRRPRQTGWPGATWEEARKRAAQSIYQGRRGRLAVIRDEQTLRFIRDNFQILEEVWIGLAFYCRARRLLWTNGEMELLEKSQHMWDRHWSRDMNLTCRHQPQWVMMPVYLTTTSSGVKWQATGPAKHFMSYIVEYPPPEQKEEAGKGDNAKQ